MELVNEIKKPTLNVASKPIMSMVCMNKSKGIIHMDIDGKTDVGEIQKLMSMGLSAVTAVGDYMEKNLAEAAKS